jgi:prepilin-type N-terminal cleavage/methylation domain-containing protein
MRLLRPVVSRPQRHAFSLVELSIVLVILGLLVGAVLTGKELIRAAALRSLVSDISRYRTATFAFRDKYFGLPGDIYNATAIWGSAGGTGSDAACDSAISATSAAVCNGNNDGEIESNAAVPFSERFYAWKELANAGLIEGNYTGHSNGAQGTAQLKGGVNAPAIKLDNISALTFAWAAGPMSGNSEMYDGGYNFNTLYLGPVLEPEDAWNIDTKLDDGSPVTGSMFAGKSTGTFMPNCTTTAVSATAQYNVTNTNLLCGFWIKSS